jgi:DNA-binding FrmR family transcriptional regulator
MTDPVLVRLKRVSGQVEGIVKMYEECRECTDVVTQIAAARAALAAVGKEVLAEEATKYAKPQDSAKLDLLLKQLFEIS